MRALPMFLLVACVGCGVEDSAAVEPPSASVEHVLDHGNPNPVLFRQDARPYGRTLDRWSELLWSYIYEQPVDHNPFFDTTGADCAVGQDGPVWFLPAVPGSSLGTDIARSCTIPRGHAVMLQLASALNDYPCPDPTFRPAPGQSLFDFLMAPISPLFDGETGFAVTLDGVAIEDPLSYRFSSDDVFQFKGNLSWQALDSCITGKRQAAVTDGFYLMFKPLSRGAHTIVVNGHDMEGTPVTLTEHLTIR